MKKTTHTLSNKLFCLFNLFLATTILIYFGTSPALASDETIPEKNYIRMSLSERQMLAEQGDNIAQLNLGLIYLQGYFLVDEPDPEQAQQWLQKSAQQGNLNAMYLLCSDDDEGAQWGKQLGEQAKQGNIAAMDLISHSNTSCQNSALGFASESNDYKKRNQLIEQLKKQVFDSYSNEVNKGNVNVQVKLANLYFHGEGVASDRDKALYWTIQAALQQDPMAMLAYAKQRQTDQANVSTKESSLVGEPASLANMSRAAIQDKAFAILRTRAENYTATPEELALLGLLTQVKSKTQEPLKMATLFALSMLSRTDLSNHAEFGLEWSRIALGMVPFDQIGSDEQTALKRVNEQIAQCQKQMTEACY